MENGCKRSYRNHHDKNIQINGTLLKAGTYSIYHSSKDKWTIIINSEVGLWGAYNYNSKLDVMRFDLPVTQSDVVTNPSLWNLTTGMRVADLLLIG